MKPKLAPSLCTFIRVIAPLLLTVSTLPGCSSPASKTNTSPASNTNTSPASNTSAFLAEAQLREVRIRDAKLAEELQVNPEDTASKVPQDLRPAAPANTRHVVVSMAFTAAKTGWHEIFGPDFVLTYESGAQKKSSPCLAFSFGEVGEVGAGWIFGKGDKVTSINLVFNEPDDKREEKLLFLVPKDVKECALEVAQAGSQPVTVARFVLASKN